MAVVGCQAQTGTQMYRLFMTCRQIPRTPDRYLRSSAGLFVCMLIAACCITRLANAGAEDHQGIAETIASLTLEEKVGQMLQIRYYADFRSFDTDEYKFLRDEIQKYHIGSLLLAMHHSVSGPVKSPGLDAARTANQFQRESKLPLLLAADLERGAASLLKDVPAFPWPMAFGAINPRSSQRTGCCFHSRRARERFTGDGEALSRKWKHFPRLASDRGIHRSGSRASGKNRVSAVPGGDFGRCGFDNAGAC